MGATANKTGRRNEICLSRKKIRRLKKPLRRNEEYKKRVYILLWREGSNKYFLKNTVALLLNCRNNVHITQFLRRKWLVHWSATPECPGSNPGYDLTIIRSFYIFSPVLILLILSIFFFFQFIFLFLIFTKQIIKKNDKYCWMWSIWSEVFGKLFWTQS